MRKISDITRREILELFQHGFDVDCLFDMSHETYPYYGRLNEIDFLKRLYPLDAMKSLDSRYPNAEQDIYQHTVNNDDYESCWVFTDERFPLANGTDKEYLTFLCEVFHPIVRIKGDISNTLFSKIQELIRLDGYELYVSDEISGQPIYSYRELSDNEIVSKRFLPFSVRNGKHCSVQKISKIIRNHIAELVTRYNENEQFTNKTNWNYWAETKDEAFKTIQEFYTPKAYNDSDEYVEATDINHLILRGSPKHVLDAIEVFYRINNSKEFETAVNQELSQIGIKLADGKIENLQPAVDVHLPKDDDSLKGLICQADILYKERNHDSLQLSVEKMWDALERVKTLFTDLDKKESSKKVIEAIVGQSTSLISHLDAEFVELTKIGNQYQIRHFETNKELIVSYELLKYLYVRCSALVNLAVKSVEQVKKL